MSSLKAAALLGLGDWLRRYGGIMGPPNMAWKEERRLRIDWERECGRGSGIGGKIGSCVREA